MRIRSRFAKICICMNAFLIAGCGASADSAQEEIAVSMQYASVVSISGTSMTVQLGTLKKDTMSISNEETKGDSSASLNFIPEGEEKKLTISSDITILKDDYTVKASEIETGDILLINYADSTLCAVEILSSPDTAVIENSK